MSIRTAIAGGFVAAACAALLAQPSPASAQKAPAPSPPHRCAAAAAAQAPKLLAFHFGPDSRIAIDTPVKVLAPLRNPANSAQRFDVLEVWGRVYKGQYRMRFLYARLPGECVLMGQEVLEYASL